MSIYDAAINRQQRVRDNARAFQPPDIHNADDIKRVLINLDPHNKLNINAGNITISTNMVGTIDGHTQRAFSVNATTTTQTYRQMIIEAFALIKRREEAANNLTKSANTEVLINGKSMTPPPVIDMQPRLAVDSVIERLLGGHRDGLRIRWDLADGYSYFYDVMQHRLTRTQRDASQS
jgi:hypothetical protein